MQKFCHNCGKQVLAAANFCSSCGTSLSSLAAKPTPPVPVEPAQTFTPVAVGGEDDDDNYLDRITKLDIKINKLDVEIVKNRAVAGEVLTPDFFKAGATQGPEVINRSQPYQGIDNKAFLAEFQREAGTNRNEN